MYITVKTAAERWEISERRIRTLWAEGKIPGAFQEGRGWKIPSDAVKPEDGRFKSTESLLCRIDRKKKELDDKLDKINEQMNTFVEEQKKKII